MGRRYFLLKNMLNLIFFIKKYVLSTGSGARTTECRGLVCQYRVLWPSNGYIWPCLTPSVSTKHVFPLRMYFGASSSRMPMVKRGRLLRRPGGSEVRCKGKIRVQYWRMVSNVVRCTRWKVITLVPDRRDPYTQWYTAPSPFCTIWVINSNLSKVALGCVPLSVGITFVKNDCNHLPLGASDHVWHHPSVVHTYFPLIM